MSWPVWICVVVLANELVGCVVLATIDRDGRLFRWSTECPVGAWLPIMLWPLVVAAWFMLGKAKR